jgi:ribosomal protein S18 acetylase RimI-like enzyme
MFLGRPLPLDAVEFTRGRGGIKGTLHLANTKEYVDILAHFARLKKPAFVVCGLKVHPLARGRGWGRELVTQAMHYAKSHRTDLYLWVEPYEDKPLSKSQLQRFYRKLGFRRLRLRAAQSWYVWRFDS